MNDDGPMFPKPKAREKKRRKGLNPGKGLNPVRPEGKRAYTRDQRARRRAEDTLYRRVSRPTYLIDLARRQGRLGRPAEAIPGESPQEKLRLLRPGELPLCEAGIPEAKCHGDLPALHIHHRKGRGPYLNDPSTYMGVCHLCHDYIENHRKWAYERGFLLSRNGQADIPES